jgi:uncharacterized membrane protein YhaH (DUF805 family)
MAMDFGGAIKSGFSKYAVFSGVASRSEFWYWTLFTQLVSMALSIVQSSSTALFPATSSAALGDQGTNQILSRVFAEGNTSILSSLWGLAIFIPTLAISARRLRDAGKSPKLLWLYLAPMAALIGAIIGLFAYAIGNPSGFCLIDGCTTRSAYSGWITVAITLGFVGLMAMALGVLFLIWFTQPTKTAAQGNKYLVQEPSMPASVEPIEPGTTA